MSDYYQRRYMAAEEDIGNLKMDIEAYRAWVHRLQQEVAIADLNTKDVPVDETDVDVGSTQIEMSTDDERTKEYLREHLRKAAKLMRAATEIGDVNGFVSEMKALVFEIDQTIGEAKKEETDA